MRDIFTVAEFTIKETVRRKSFIISMLIIIAIIVIGFNIPNIINYFSGTESSKEKILIIDKDNIFGESLIQINDNENSYNYTILKEDLSDEIIKEKLKNEEFDSCLKFSKENEKIKIDYVVESLMMGQTVPESLIEEFSTQYTAIQIQKSGLTQEQIKKMFTEFEVNVIQTDENAASENTFIAMMLSIVLFYAIYFCAYQVSTSITTEKTSKIIETLVTSTTPKKIVLGKTIGIGIVGLCQIIAIVGTAYFSAKSFLPPKTLENVFDMSSITPTFATSIIIYFLLGYSMYALLYALTGSLVSKPEDIQSANTPVAILAVIGFYLAYFSMMNPASNINLFASIFPISSPFCMPLRILVGSQKPLEIVYSIAILCISILIIARVSIKIYSDAILNYGTKMNLRNVLNIYKSKNK